MTPDLIHGGCLCGAVRYTASSRPYNITHCHCADCRRASAAAFVTWASVRRQDFRFTHGEPRTFPWASRLRSFCPSCGTPLTFMSSPDSDEVDVTVCSFDTPDTILPADHTWTSDKLPWVRLADHLPEHARSRPGRTDCNCDGPPPLAAAHR